MKKKTEHPKAVGQCESTNMYTFIKSQRKENEKGSTEIFEIQCWKIFWGYKSGVFDQK